MTTAEGLAHNPRGMIEGCAHRGGDHEIPGGHWDFQVILDPQV